MRLNYQLRKWIMEKVEQYIKEHTRNCSNQSKWGVETTNKSIIYVYPWLTPDQAKEAVEIAREEIYNWLANHYRDYMHNPTGKKLEAFFGMDMITDLKQAMKNEEVR